MPSPTEWRQIEDLYYDALELPDAERAAFLTRACDADESLQREVASLLAARAEAHGFLSQPIVASTPLNSIHPEARLGTRVGQYQLLSLLGTGGMGEVFLAEDTRLHRQVALKLLPTEFSQNPQRIHRFEQEARATTALNHPNIVTLHDTGQHEGVYYIVTEFVDGQTLREHLNQRGALPVSEALDLAQQIAKALAAAHAADIVHRDIKPENVMLRRDGFVKVLDFGLAKLTDATPDMAQDETRDEETPHSQTAAGALLGTIRYMSPEQARGETVDARTDVFSLGVVLYEMLTGQHPFARATATQTMAAILEAEPAVLSKTVPAALQWLVTSALHKDRDQRLPTAEEFAVALQRANDEWQFSARLADEPVWRGWWRRWPVWFSALALALAGYLAWQSRQKFDSINLTDLKFVPVYDWKTEPEESAISISISPDEKMMAFTRVVGGQRDIFVRPVDGGEAVNLTNDIWLDDNPIWSPDGRQLIYLSTREGKRELRRLSRSEKVNERIAELSGTELPGSPPPLLRWSRDGQRIYYLNNECDLHALELASGVRRRLTNLRSKNCQIYDMALSFDEHWIVYSKDTAGVRQIWAEPLQGGTAVQITGEGSANVNPVWHPDGQRVIYSCQRNNINQVCVGYLDGRLPKQLTFSHENLKPFSVGTFGKRIFYHLDTDDVDLFQFDLNTGNEMQLSSGRLHEFSPTISSYSQTVVFQQTDSELNLLASTIWKKAIDRNAQPVQLASNAFDPRWSPQGGQLAFMRRSGGSGSLWVIDADGRNERPLVPDNLWMGRFAMRPFHWLEASNYSWSPDGRRLAYSSSKSGAWNIWTINSDGTEEHRLSSNEEAAVTVLCPLWSPRNDQIIYLTRQAVEGKSRHKLVVAEPAQERILWQTDRRLRPLGWAATGMYFFAVVVEQTLNGRIADLQLLRISPLTGASNPVAQLTSVYVNSLLLAPAGKQIAFVRRNANHDELWSVSLEEGQRKKHLVSADTYTDIAGLAWSPSNHAIFFSKQSHAISLWAIDNFR